MSPNISKMESGQDFLDLLDPDMSVKILMCLDDLSDLVRASAVSSTWRDFVITNGVCKQLCLRLFPQLHNLAGVSDTSDKTKKTSDVGSSKSAEQEFLRTEHRIYASLARYLTSSEVVGCISATISASSTDNYPEESIHNTLDPRDRIGQRAIYWSSSGQSNPEVPEKLTYKLVSDFCVIKEISLQPFQAFFQANFPIYSSRAVRFRMGHHISPDDGGGDRTVGEGQPFADDKFVWTYTSQEFPMAQENCLQTFKFPGPVLCVGGILQIELLGRVQRQEMDGLFYICIAHVKVTGRPLSPVFGIQILEPSGKFLLKYNPDGEYSTPPSFPEDLEEIAITPEVVERHVRGWEQILHMLRGTLGVEVYDSDDEPHDSDDEVHEEGYAA